ncbi:hypothetical protein TEA_010501 [Camellia sinensis var. sinensis]|uniref:cellulase n=1 Tax=Camellia sinensis var. sinensis TaxID=542762 RepID=A0A4V3WPM9_CAMSN|nr:hypothetical protein TEA_010501 [Camellia sinensis var. sinensis]
MIMVMRMRKVVRMLLVLLMNVMMMVVNVANSQDYGEALTKSLLFFEGQRSGKLPPSQRITWRKDSALLDGSDLHVDLVGGYYDAGDNVKFHFPMAYTTTMLAWGVLEFGEFMGSDLQHTHEAIRWATDYFLKATSVPGDVYAQVGNPYGDHNCWERPEDMETPRTTYAMTENKPGSEVSAEIAAALAASSMVFYGFDHKFRGSYNDGLGPAVCPFYCSGNGYQDELIWAAAWLHKATKATYYWNYVTRNVHSLDSVFAEFGWDAKHAGINILLSKSILSKRTQVCSVLPESPTKSVTYSPGGLLLKPGGGNMQHVTTLSFLLIVYSRYLYGHGNMSIVHCDNVAIKPARLVHVAKGQASLRLLVLFALPTFLQKIKAFQKHTREMALEEVPNVRLDALENDDAVDLVEQYRTERRVGGEGVSAGRPRSSTLRAATKPISQVEPDHWHTKADKSTFTAEELEVMREKYQIPVEIELKLPTSKERASDARPGEFVLYEEANEGAEMTVDEFFACYKASGQQETWVTLQAAAEKGLVAGLPSSIKGWRPRWFYVSTNGGVGVRTMWRVPTKSVEPRLGAAAEETVKKVKAWREKEGAKWDDFVQPSALFAARLGPQPTDGDFTPVELETRRRAQEAEDRASFSKDNKYRESQEKANKEVEAVVKKKKRVREREEGLALKKVMEVVVEKTAEVGLEAMAKGMKSGATGPENPMEGGATGVEEGVEQQPTGGLAPQGETTADRLLGVVEDATVRAMESFIEAELLRGLCSSQMEPTTLAGALLKKAAYVKGEVEPLKAKLGEVKAQLESLRKETAGWRKTA